MLDVYKIIWWINPLWKFKRNQSSLKFLVLEALNDHVVFQCYRNEVRVSMTVWSLSVIEMIHECLWPYGLSVL